MKLKPITLIALLLVAAVFTIASVSAQQGDGPYSKHHPTPTCCQFKPKDEPAQPAQPTAAQATATPTVAPLLPETGADLEDK